MTATRSTLVGLLTLALCNGIAVDGAQQTGIDRELDEAKALYREARFAQAIGKLQETIGHLRSLQEVLARRLLLTDAYLHLTLSYVALNDPAPAKESLKAMLRVDRDKRLDPEVYAPKVIELLQQARAEVAMEPAQTGAERAGPVSAAPPLAAAPKKKGGSKTLPILVGAGGAAVIGLAVAARGGGGTSTSPAPPNTPARTPAPTSTCVLTQGRTYVISGAPDPSQGIFVDDFLKVFLNDALVTELNQGGHCCPPAAPVRFRANSGDTLTLEARDGNNCYSLDALYLQKDDGTCLRQLTAAISGPNCGHEPPMQLFFRQGYVLP